MIEFSLIDYSIYLFIFYNFQLCLSDPVHRCPLWKFVSDKLHECHAIYGQDTFKELMDCVDSAVTTQLGSFINH